MLGAPGVQIPENNLDDLHSSREEDGTSEIMDPQDLLGSFLLADIDLIILGLGVSLSRAVGFLRGTSAVVVILVKGHAFPTIVKVRPVGACVFTDRWRLDELAYGIPSDGPYQTNPPSIEDIISSIRIDREGQVRRIRHEEEIVVLEYQILTGEIVSTLKPLEEIIRENVLCLGNQDYVPACLCFMLYCVVHSERFNLAYYMAKRMEWVTKQARLILL
ncbi:hypothetical protein Tco_1219422 [Tanacetum coccineum]